jgi:hypothetical protein
MEQAQKTRRKEETWRTWEKLRRKKVMAKRKTRPWRQRSRRTQQALTNGNHGTKRRPQQRTQRQRRNDDCHWHRTQTHNGSHKRTTSA